MEDFKSFIGQILNSRYRLIRVIGSGGMAVVFEANDLMMRRKVAIKILRDEVARDPQAVRRFVNESKAVTMLSHPNIVTVYDINVSGKLKYLVMEYIPGITLKNYMQKKGVLSTKEVVSYSEQILRALQHAHAKGIIHRDIKPQNIMLLRDGSIKVADFGIAKIPHTETITMTDNAIGTVSYISPEQANGHNIDCRSDLYSVGVMMYEMATGRLPFEADSPVTVALKHINEKAVDVRELNPALPTGLGQIIMWAMEKNIYTRFQSAEQMLKFLLKLKSSYTTVFKNAPKGAPMSQRKKASGSKRGRNRKASKSMLPIIFGVCCALLVVILISGIYLLNDVIFSGASGSYRTVTIPSFIGEAYSEQYENELEEALYNVTVEHVFDDSKTPGTIIGQSPSENETRKIKMGSTKISLKLTVSTDVSEKVMKDYRAEDARRAEIAMREDGYGVTRLETYDDLILKGCVVSTVPAAGDSIADGEMIYMYVSLGSNVEMMKVPNFVGKTSLEAWQLLIDSNLMEGTVTYVYSDKEAGTVISQTPEAGSDTPLKLSKIDFVISMGKEEGSKVQNQGGLNSGSDDRVGGFVGGVWVWFE